MISQPSIIAKMSSRKGGPDDQTDGAAQNIPVDTKADATTVGGKAEQDGNVHQRDIRHSK